MRCSPPALRAQARPRRFSPKGTLMFRYTLSSLCWRPPTCHSALAETDTRPKLVPHDANARLLLSPVKVEEREKPALKAPSIGCDQDAVALC
jgi:hypothetical protein